jgi:CDGSH-type Zn-finger protein
MSEVTVLCRNNGPYWIIGDFKLVDADGNPIEIPEAKRKTTPEGLPRVALCRCGGSVMKPFCDGTHSRIGFIGAATAVQQAESGNPPTNPSTPPTPPSP